VKGGFQLAREPKKISLLDVVEATEGPLSLNQCVIDENRCSRSNSCAVHPVWVEITRSVEDRLKAQNFSNLLQ
jgi:Rrf2 family protein